MPSSKIINDEDFTSLEENISNLWKSSDRNAQNTYNRICYWLDSLKELEPELDKIREDRNQLLNLLRECSTTLEQLVNNSEYKDLDFTKSDFDRISNAIHKNREM